MSQPKPRTFAAQIRRATRFQLAPLVDLLLIIVFAQFLEVRTTVRQQTLAMQQQVESSAEQLVVLQERQIALVEQERLQREQTIKSLRSIAAAFNLPDEQILGYADSADADVTNALARVAQQAQSFADDSPEDIIRFLVGHQELLKRAEIWNLHVGGDRKATLTAADQKIRFGLERRGQDARMAEFEDAMFAAYKQLPQPKELVVILASYSPDAVAGVYQPMIDATPGAIERMRNDDPTIRFEYTVLGATEAP